jgi:adenine-specific DNA-methyltransferase
VDYIVKNTVGKLVEGKSPAQLKGFRVLDPACGSGSFLLGAYQYLLDYALAWYTANDPAQWMRGKTPALYQTAATATQPAIWRLTTHEKKRLLTEHIYGVDIDRQAVEVTKLSLLLKVLENESDESLGQQMTLFADRVLPNLDNNIKCGNSLIGPDYFENQLIPDPDEFKRINAFDWKQEFPNIMKAGGFDVVIGNPPYIKEYANSQPFHDLQNTHLAKYYQGKMDIWYIFACLSIDLMKTGGLHSFIATNNWITNSGASILRQKLLKEAQVHEFVDFGDYHVFNTASIQTMIYLIQKTGTVHQGRTAYRRFLNAKANLTDVIDFLSKNNSEHAATIDSQIETGGNGNAFTFVNDGDAKLLNHISEKGSYRLSPEDVAQGIVLPQDFVLQKHLDELSNSKINAGSSIRNYAISG